MQESFLRKVLTTALAGLAAAGMLWAFRHIVSSALYESGEGWRDSLKKPTPARTR